MSTEKPSPETAQTPETLKKPKKSDSPKEIGGYEHKLEPTRYGDWESGGRCTDF